MHISLIISLFASTTVLVVFSQIPDKDAQRQDILSLVDASLLDRRTAGCSHFWHGMGPEHYLTGRYRRID